MNEIEDPRDSSQPPLTVADWGAVVTALVLPTVITWIYFYGAESAAAGVQLAVFNAVKIIQFVLPVAWVLFVQKGSLRLRPTSARGVATGLIFGLLVAAAAGALYAGVLRGSDLIAGATPEIDDKLAGWKIDTRWEFALLGLGYSLVHSLLEEYYWRWFVFGQLCRSTALPTAIVVSSLGFMAHHVLVLGKFFGFDNPATWLLSACVAIGGAVWAWLYHRSGSLLGPWLSHLLVDAAIFSIGFAIVSGRLS
jgi:membrane protease YdiL (CAAX protease family)